MGKKRFFDDRLKYLSFIQNTSEKKAISEKIFKHISSMPRNKSYLRILDAGTGDGTINSNIIKAFHKFHPYASLYMTGKEISYEDLKNTLEKMPDRFVEHPNLVITMTNVKFSELEKIEQEKKLNKKIIKRIDLILDSDNSFDFNQQIQGSKISNFIKKYWGIEIDSNGRTSYSNPCVIRIYRKDQTKYLNSFINKKKIIGYDLVIASQAYRAASSAKIKVNNVIGPLMKILNESGVLLITHSCGGKSVQKILKMAFKDKEAFPNTAKDILKYIENNLTSGEKKFKFSKPTSYEFNFKRSPDQTVSELFGHGTDAKWANILYVGQIAEKEIENLEKNVRLLNKVKKQIEKEKELKFENEIFKIQRLY